jgi:hypothetical protein
MNDVEVPAFQRARRPEQRELRRREILDAAEALLGEMPAEEISLRELGRRLGVSKPMWCATSRAARASSWSCSTC